ncbi:DUF305 domain-containing protein [Actinomadura scrupuli]|uniref:DUF305 domain-containing protein n=1 Tax=Actinomadura scrupuli TaxID=559629 RepID=UPI003D99DD7D
MPVAALTLAACGSDHDSMSGHSMNTSSAPAGGATAPAAGQHNDQDVTFTQMMIPHHQQAIEMAKIANTRASMKEVKTLATTIEGAQGPEIEKMTGWLKTWGAPTTMPSMEGMPGMDHGQGMMSGAEMKRLGKLSGMAFDKAFLQMMIKHHQGAVAMAKTEQAQGQFPDAKTLASTIVTSQTAEIATMRNLLKGM